ncbi:hypothetical protein NPIL_239941 [Nephila pilipes]|uniref:RING-type domain-containing protein n=1 Tax=Nephila pilipes TaxID=299642 RepID=A0A8X6NQ23_NEPPI|nr:hypothetical protein NPIL_239941 [Nephila pilipes]
MKPDFHRTAAVAWHRRGFESMEDAGTKGDEHSAACPDAVFGEPETCPVCLLVMHRPVNPHCEHVFHVKCLKRAPITNPAVLQVLYCT